LSRRKFSDGQKLSGVGPSAFCHDTNAKEVLVWRGKNEKGKQIDDETNLGESRVN